MGLVGHGDRQGRHYYTTFLVRVSVYSSGDCMVYPPRDRGEFLTS